MKPEDMQDAFNHIDDQILEETDQVRQNPKRPNSIYLRYQSVAAILMTAILLGSIVGIALTNRMNDSGDTGGNASQENSSSPKKEVIENTPTSGTKDETSLESSYTVSNADVECYESAQMDFAVQLLQKTAKEYHKNILLSPLSVTQALSMTANGAKGKTLSEMENLLGNKLTLDKLNLINQNILSSLTNSDNICKLQLANSIWAREDLIVNESFLKTNKKYYQAEVFTEAFAPETVNKINNWVKENTDSKIEQIIDEIDIDTVMFLINALSFDAEWQTIYSEYSIYTDNFYPNAAKKKTQKAEMMRSEESLYLNDGNATGFIKNYKNCEYRFVALLPNEDMSLNEYLHSLTGESILKTLTKAEQTTVKAVIPKFKYDYSTSLKSLLKEMGMTTAFNSKKADLSNLGSSGKGNLYISDVLHKTFISLDEKGTEAGATTAVIIKAEGASPQQEKPKEVILNRPFLYMILDGKSNLPVFIGTVTEL